MGQDSPFEITETMLAARDWKALPGVTHGFGTRHVSRSQFFAQLSDGAAPLRPVLLRQIHSDRVLNIGNEFDFAAEPPRADALVTDQPGVGLVIKTADCLPILLVDPAARVSGAAHAGWRGTAQRIAEKTVAAMRSHYSVDPARIRAAIGPGIHACCYQVGEDVLNTFRAQFAYAEELFRGYEHENPADNILPRQVMSPGHPLMRKLEVARAWLDLEEANRRQLLDAGLSPDHITTGAPCTACRTDLLYSYRREREAAGRLLSLVALRS